MFTQLSLLWSNDIVVQLVQVRQHADHHQPVVVNLCGMWNYLRAWIILQPQHLQLLQLSEVTHLLDIL